MQVDPIKPTLEAPGIKRLKLEHDELLSSFAFNFNFRLFPVLAGSDLPPCFRWCVEVVTDNAIDAARLTVGGAG